jgi:hypothetical protein
MSERQADAKIKITPRMIEAAARVIADRFDLEIGGYAAIDVAECVLKLAFEADAASLSQRRDE